jgi:hypothetical protein
MDEIDGDPTRPAVGLKIRQCGRQLQIPFRRIPRLLRFFLRIASGAFALFNASVALSSTNHSTGSLCRNSMAVKRQIAPYTGDKLSLVANPQKRHGIPATTFSVGQIDKISRCTVRRKRIASARSGCPTAAG